MKWVNVTFMYIIFLNHHRIRTSWNTRCVCVCVCVCVPRQLTHAGRGAPPPRPRSLAQRETHSEIRACSRELLNSGHSCLEISASSFLIRAEATVGLYRASVSVSASSLTCSHFCFNILKYASHPITSTARCFSLQAANIEFPTPDLGKITMD